MRQITPSLSDYEKIFFLKSHLKPSSEASKVIANISEYSEAIDILKVIVGDVNKIVQKKLNGIIELILEVPLNSK